MTSQRERKEITINKLLNAAEELLLEQGYEGATVQAILDRTGLSKGAFYHNFGSKDDLFWELLQEKVTRIREEFWKTVSEKKDLYTPTGFMVGSSLSLSVNPVIQTIYSYYNSKASHNEESMQRVRDIHELRKNLAMESIGNAKKSGFIPDNVDIDELSTVVLALSIGLGFQISANPDKVPFTKYVNTFQSIVLAAFQGHGFNE